VTQGIPYFCKLHLFVPRGALKSLLHGDLILLHCGIKGGNRMIREVGRILPDYMASEPRVAVFRRRSRRKGGEEGGEE
jgi:hypothetical protein